MPGAIGFVMVLVNKVSRCACVRVSCVGYIRIDCANFFSGGGGLPLAKIIRSSGLLPDYITCDYNRLAMLGH